MFKISESKKNTGKKCCAYGCSNEPVPRKGNLCHKHYARKRRELDPVYSRYNQAKSKAKSRGISFTITLEQFWDFCIRNDYILKKGNRGQNATMDRRCNLHGYHIWNIQLMTNRQNASKGNRFNESDDKFDCPY